MSDEEFVGNYSVSGVKYIYVTNPSGQQGISPFLGLGCSNYCLISWKQQHLKNRVYTQLCCQLCKLSSIRPLFLPVALHN